MLASFSFIAGGITTLVVSNIVTKPIEVVHYDNQQQIYYNQISEQVAPVQQKTAKIVVVKTNEVIQSTGDPVWSVQLVIDGKVVNTVPALIGRASKQNANRHVAGNKSPLPKGKYVIETSGISGPPYDDPELGKGYWIPVEPMFGTQRSALGFHQDPSWGKQNGESGTSGCIGLKTVEDTKVVLNWIRVYNIREVVVND